MTMQCYINKEKLGDLVGGLPIQTTFKIVAGLYYKSNSVGIVSEPELPEDLELDPLADRTIMR